MERMVDERAVFDEGIEEFHASCYTTPICIFISPSSAKTFFPVN